MLRSVKIWFPQEGSCQQWLVLEAELVMRDSEVVGTKNPTGHSLLVDCRFELPFGEFCFILLRPHSRLLFQPSHTCLRFRPTMSHSLPPPLNAFWYINKISLLYMYISKILYSTGMHILDFYLFLSRCEWQTTEPLLLYKYNFCAISICGRRSEPAAGTSPSRYMHADALSLTREITRKKVSPPRFLCVFCAAFRVAPWLISKFCTKRSHLNSTQSVRTFAVAFSRQNSGLPI